MDGSFGAGVGDSGAKGQRANAGSHHRGIFPWGVRLDGREVLLVELKKLLRSQQIEGNRCSSHWAKTLEARWSEGHAEAGESKLGCVCVLRASWMLTFLVLNSMCVCRAHHTQRKPLFILSVCFAQLFVCRRTATGCLSRPANLPIMTPRRRRKNLCESALFEGLLGEEQLQREMSASLEDPAWAVYARLPSWNPLVGREKGPFMSLKFPF